MVRCVWLCPCYSAIRPAFLFGGHFSFRRNENTIPIRIIRIFSTLRLCLTVAGLKMTVTLVGLLY